MEYNLSYKRRLPHFQPKDGVFFITFRLNFPIPKKFLIAYNSYKEHLEVNLKNKEDKEANSIIKKKLFAYADQYYNECNHGISITGNRQVAQIISDKIISMQDNFFYLYIFTLMPNHVHLLIKPALCSDVPVKLTKIMQTLKGATSRQVNQHLSRTGSFWAREYYDYWVRRQEELYNIFEYIRLNPVKARLVNDAKGWKWTWINPEYLK